MGCRGGHQQPNRPTASSRRGKAQKEGRAGQRAEQLRNCAEACPALLQMQPAAFLPL